MIFSLFHFSLLLWLVPAFEYTLNLFISIYPSIYLNQLSSQSDTVKPTSCHRCENVFPFLIFSRFYVF